MKYHLHDSYEYIIVLYCFDLEIKHFSSVHGCGDEQLKKCNIFCKGEKHGHVHIMTLIEHYANLPIARYRWTNMIYKGAKCIYVQFNHWEYFE